MALSLCPRCPASPWAARTSDAFDTARSFYGGTLALIERPVPASLSADVLWFAVGDQELHLFAEPSVGSEVQSRRHAGLQVTDVLAVRARLTDDGVETFDGLPTLPGRPRFFAADPFGNVLEFLEVATFSEP